MMRPLPLSGAVLALVLGGCAATAPPPVTRAAPCSAPDWPAPGLSALCNPGAPAAATLSARPDGLSAVSTLGGYLTALSLGGDAARVLTEDRPVAADEAVPLPPAAGPAVAIYTDAPLEERMGEGQTPLTAINALSLALRTRPTGSWWSAMAEAKPTRRQTR